MIHTMIEEHTKVKDPLKEEDAMGRMRGHLIEEDIRMEVTLGEGIQIRMEDPLEEGDPLMEMEDPQMIIIIIIIIINLFIYHAL